MNFKAIIFDLDGTLLDSLNDLADAMNLVLARNGFDQHAVDDYRYFIGHGFEILVQRALPPEKRDPGTMERCVDELHVEYAGRWTRKTRPYPGIPDLLNACTSAGLKTAVLTNKPDGLTQEVVSRLMPDAPFAFAWGSGRDFPRKPDPAGALRLAERFGVHPSQCLFLGDTAVDMETARTSGMFALGASGYLIKPFDEEEVLRTLDFPGV